MLALCAIVQNVSRLRGFDHKVLLFLSLCVPRNKLVSHTVLLDHYCASDQSLAFNPHPSLLPDPAWKSRRVYLRVIRDHERRQRSPLMERAFNNQVGAAHLQFRTVAHKWKLDCALGHRV
ncbi:hypothetical protein NDU88_000691 [Pleurodeles waltl]|uniref:Uncharacterized protein n=1 Tax=Pleurodeles waltl TaxID=8319 RepID=A0AAV7LAH6_PLEWA|nr:hypothetical protein NDU88_000691 [Pleurodeles waltl]